MSLTAILVNNDCENAFILRYVVVERKEAGWLEF